MAVEKGTLDFVRRLCAARVSTALGCFAGLLDMTATVGKERLELLEIVMSRTDLLYY